MGLLRKLARGYLPALFGGDPHSTADMLRICRFEPLEPRRPMAADLHLGAVYFEEASGDDSAGDTIEITFAGGASGTQLTQLEIDGDILGDGQLTIGDMFFDIAPGGPGSFNSVPLQIVSSTGFQVTGITVVDGSSKLLFTFSGFDPGEKLVFTVDVDEKGAINSTSVAEGGEFEGTRMTGTFTAAHFHTITKTATFYDAYDANMAQDDATSGHDLNLPPDVYIPPDTVDRSDRTAGATIVIEQIPLPITISGTVFDDPNLSNSRDAGELGIQSVQLTLLRWNGSQFVATGQTAFTNADGFYKFEGVLPGTYQVVEAQPSPYFSVGAKAGTVNGVTDGVVTSPDIISQIVLLGGQDSVHNDFAEALPASLSGWVYHDRDNDGVRDQGEEGIGGVTIVVQPIQTIVPGFQPIQVVTGQNGSWSVTGLAPGSYRVYELAQPPGYLDGLDTAGNAGGAAVNPGEEINGISLKGAQAGIEYNFGELLPGSISGRVHANNDGDCELDPGEKLLSGVTIQLLNQQGNVIASTLTDVNGEYEFTGLAPGIYGVREIQPLGYLDGEDHVGSAGGTLGDDLLTSIVMTSGLQAEDYNFCEHEPLCLSGYVYVDDNNNGIFDQGETPLAGVTLQLLNANGNPTGATATTDETGYYCFEGLPPGTYGVREIQPVGYYDGLDTPGTVGGTAQNPGDRITGAVLTFGHNGEQYNFGELRGARISGSVHADPEGDCEIGPNDIPLEGVKVHLLNANGTVIDTTFTDEHGNYSFENLAPGTYGIREEQPVGYFDSEEEIGTAGGVHSDNDQITQIVLGSGQSGEEYNFCENLPVSLSGYVYADDDNDGVFDPQETGIAGVRLWLLDAQGQRTGASVLTVEGGFYKFDNLAPGVYGVTEIQPTGYFDGIDTPGNAGGAAIGPDTITGAVLDPSVHGVNYNFGELRAASIRGRVHADEDGNCELDPGEVPLAGVRIHLLDANGTVIATTLTDANGEYEFVNLRPGTYSVKEEQPAGYFDSGDMVGSAGGDLGNDLISNITLGAGVDAVEYNFCEEPPASISGRVHADEDGDCELDVNESPISGVKIELLDANGNVVATTFTDSDGLYKFEGLAPGEYSVREHQPAGYFDGEDDVGSAGGELIENDLISNITLGAGVNATDYNFCEIPPASISGRVHADKDGDCELDENETPITGVKIDLLDANGNVVATTFTDSDGLYKFEGLAPGVYSVYEHQPAGYLDGGDMVGSAGGQLGNDLISDITLDAGVDATDYNFCEIPPRTPPPPPENPPEEPRIIAFPGPALPPPVPYIPPVILPQDVPEYYSGSSSVINYTWHLSVIDAGYPRGTDVNESVVSLVSTRFDVLNWEGIDLTQARWTLKKDVDEELIFGALGALPISGDFDGDGTTELGVFIDGHWFIDLNGNGIWDEGDLWAKLGHRDDLPVVGDWDGDGKDDIGIFGPAWAGDPRAIQAEPGLPDPQNAPTGARKNVPPRKEEAALGARSLKLTSRGKLRADVIDHVFLYGQAGDAPVSGDWAGDGIDTIGIFNKGTWHIDTNGDGKWTDADETVTFGADGDKPVVGDFDGNGVDDLGVFRAGTFYLDANKNRKLDGEDRIIELGSAGDIPVVGDWNADGKDELGVYHHGESQPRTAAVPDTAPL